MVSKIERPKRIHFEATLSGEVNGNPIRLEGKGIIGERSGITRGSYTLLEVPKGFDPHLFGTFLITGYPHSSKLVGGAQNIFFRRTYSYTRTVIFDDKNILKFNARCERLPDMVKSTFVLEGSVSVPKLVRMEPLVEIWTPRGSGRIDGHFTANWRTEDDELITGDVNTQYSIETKDALKSVQHRFITMKTKVQGNHLTKDQFVTLWKNLPGHGMKVN